MPILRQICLANESLGGSPIVILAEREKEEMDEEITRNEIACKGSPVICRSGNPLLKHDLDKVNAEPDPIHLSYITLCRFLYIQRVPSLYLPISNLQIKAMPVF